MGTLGKALGSYGAYILSSFHINEYLQNRAKSLIYATAPSVLDIELAHQGFLYMEKHKSELFFEIQNRKKIVKKYFDYDMDGLIFPYKLDSSKEAIEYKKVLEKASFSVGAIRPPTVEVPILRIIPRINIEKKEFERLCTFLAGIKA